MSRRRDEAASAGEADGPGTETVAGRRRGQLAESEEVGRRHQSRERPGPRWAGRTLGPWAAGKRAPALPASPTPTPSAASFVPCGSGASRWPASCGVPPSVAPPLAPAPLPALPPPPGPSLWRFQLLPRGCGDVSGHRLRPWPSSQTEDLLGGKEAACLPQSTEQVLGCVAPRGPPDTPQRAWCARCAWSGRRALVPCWSPMCWGPTPAGGPCPPWPDCRRVARPSADPGGLRLR